MNVDELKRPATPSLSQLTDKEREVLDHLAGHKSSKEIALALGIHENTVNKHIGAIRGKWGTRDRYETARTFRRLHDKGDEIHPPQILPRDAYLISEPQAPSDLPRSTHFRLSDVAFNQPFDLSEDAAPAGLEALDSRFGQAWRIAAIPLLGLLLVLVLIGGLAIAQAFSDIV